MVVLSYRFLSSILHCIACDMAWKWLHMGADRWIAHVEDVYSFVTSMLLRLQKVPSLESPLAKSIWSIQPYTALSIFDMPTIYQD